MATIEIRVGVTVPQDWIEMVRDYSDLFQTNHCGYWLQGLAKVAGRGWLAREDPNEEGELGLPKDWRQVVQAFKRGEAPPEGYFLLDEALACKAFGEGCKKYGLDWYEQADANQYDLVLQLALLGEIRYG